MYLTLLLLTNASDIELNPGPASKYPCQICARPVTWKQRGLACDDCDQWYHVECMHMSTPVYEALAYSNVPRQCASCGMPQFSTSLFNSFVADTSNTTTGVFISISPTYKKRSLSCEKEDKILTVNFQSARNKREEIHNPIDSSDPDIILGTETWLNSNIHIAKLFPPSYELIRNDRSDGYGGVLIALKKEIIFERLPSTPDANVEAIFIKISLPKKNFLIVGALYRPPSSTPKYMEDLCQSVESLHSHDRNAVIWLGGDLNLPDIDWETQSSSGNQYPMSIKQRFLEMLQNCDLQQMVSFPIRLTNCLDLFLSNRPTLLSKCAALPGISDHDIVLIESSVVSSRNRSVKRKILLWKHANMKDFREDCLAFQQAFTEQFDRSSPVQVMWDNITTTVSHMIEKHVPSKMTSTWFNEP
ncbi:uncharacterized protein LOC115921326 [Strongylocentrotus purpuratus]|uniref:Zinc finger PHD-type domain-containing protein n=1 Tax=Strongylocentrotus purpuratus TaxID=7668 RepID=A0A7M7SVN1_STRPU|nr:uncharacterized protein LOC115921326 [Strongylocentrotus purpuratus]